MTRAIITALDIGTSTVQTVVAEKKKGEEGLRILGIGMASAAGIRRGAVADQGDAMLSIRKAVDEARKSSGVPIKNVSLSVGGAQISVSSSRGVVAVSRADGEISPEDVRRSITAAESFVTRNPNKEIVHIIPRDFKIDNENGIKDPIGMHGVRLEVDSLIIENSVSSLKNLFKCVEGAGLKINDYLFSPLAASHAVLSKRQKELGVMLLDIGGGTASFMVFEEGVPIHAGVIPIGGAQVTNDIAIGLRVHVDAAERIKIAHGSCLPESLSKRETIKLADFAQKEIFGDSASQNHELLGSFPRFQLAEIIEARLQDLFELLQKELKKIGRAELLPAGVVLVGGSATIPGIVELTKREMKLPVEIGVCREYQHAVDERLASAFSTVFGVLIFADTKSNGVANQWEKHLSHFQHSPFLKWLQSFLP
ncbi:MAG: cell division protein FtsA [Candidatus Colwellbacteria bacterium]|nr:cell division protein FtsA [Candidatus Colwellbacteria bacterium]